MRRGSFTLNSSYEALGTRAEDMFEDRFAFGFTKFLALFQRIRSINHHHHVHLINHTVPV